MKKLLLISFVLGFVGCSSSEKADEKQKANSDLSAAVDGEGGGNQSDIPVDQKYEPENKKKDDIVPPPSSPGDSYKKYREARIQKSYQSMNEAAGEILAHNPNDTKILNSLASAAIEQNKPDLARLLIGKVLNVEPNNATALNNLGVIELQSENLRQALVNFKRALEGDSKNRFALANLGAIYLQYRNYQTSASMLESAVDRGDNSPETYSNYAVALTGLGQFDKAATQYERALSKDQGNSKIMLNYAALLIEKLGNSKKAISYLNKVRFVASEPAIIEKVEYLTKKAESAK